MIKVVLLAANRLRSTSAAYTPVLNHHLWLHILGFVERSWWPAQVLTDSSSDASEGSDSDIDGDVDGDIDSETGSGSG